MYFKVEPGSTIYDILMDVHEQMKVSKKACKDLSNEVGADGYSSSTSTYIAGEINAFHFSSCEQPYQSWRRLQDCWFMPMVSKKHAAANKDILQKLADIPRVNKDILAESLLCKPQGYVSESGGLGFFTIPNVEWREGVILLTFPTKIDYNPVPGLIEIITSEYKKLSQKEALNYEE